MKRNKPKDVVIWEGVGVYHGMLESKAATQPPELCKTKGYVERITENYVLIRHNKGDKEGDWTRIPASLVKKLVRGKKPL